jgi:hypothetical protein
MNKIALSSFSKEQFKGTCHGFSVHWQIGHMPVPAIARTQLILMPFVL